MDVRRHPNPKVRVGRDNDGGYVIVDGLSYDHFVSCGISTDTSFEVDFLNRHPDIRCHAFDGTIDALPEPHDRITFHKLNVSYKCIPDATTNLVELVSSLDGDIFLKMDIEGWEFPWINAVTPHMLNRFKQIVVEFHNPSAVPSHWMCLEKLAASHDLCHVHGNNYRGRDDHGLPQVIECTYVRRDGEQVPPHGEGPIPGPLDMPNDPAKPDLKLN